MRISCLTEKRAACCKPDATPNSATAIGKIQGLQTSRNCSKYADLSKRYVTLMETMNVYSLQTRGIQKDEQLNFRWVVKVLEIKYI